MMEENLLQGVKVVAFDADDTLWLNEPYFEQIEKKFCGLLEDYATHHSISQELFKTEIKNLPLYGYGVKGYTLSMIETAIAISGNTLPIAVIEKTLAFGKELLNKPVEVFEGIETVLQALKSKYRLVVATKGDLLDQEGKLTRSGLENYFHHIEVMSDKKDTEYLKLLKHLDIKADEFLMVGNSLKSDILPVLELGGHAIHIPFHTTWAHEKIDYRIEHKNFKQFEKISEILNIL
jgi:putative hydrolase of the HAD superfamily